VGGDAWEIGGRLGGGRKVEESKMGGGDVRNRFLQPHNLHFFQHRVQLRINLFDTRAGSDYYIHKLQTSCV